MLKKLLVVLISILFSGCERDPEPCEPIIQIQVQKVPVECPHKKVICGKLKGELDYQLGQSITCIKKYKVELKRCENE